MFLTEESGKKICAGGWDFFSIFYIIIVRSEEPNEKKSLKLKEFLKNFFPSTWKVLLLLENMFS